MWITLTRVIDVVSRARYIACVCKLKHHKGFRVQSSLTSGSQIVMKIYFCANLEIVYTPPFTCVTFPYLPRFWMISFPHLRRKTTDRRPLVELEVIWHLTRSRAPILLQTINAVLIRGRDILQAFAPGLFCCCWHLTHALDLLVHSSGNMQHGVRDVFLIPVAEGSHLCFQDNHFAPILHLLETRKKNKTLNYSEAMTMIFRWHQRWLNDDQASQKSLQVHDWLARSLAKGHGELKAEVAVHGSLSVLQRDNANPLAQTPNQSYLQVFIKIMRNQLMP